MRSIEKKPSPSRTYVAMCNKGDFSGHYFRRFYLPETLEDLTGRYDFNNNHETAAWYFLNKLNFVACLDGIVTAEDFANIIDEEELVQRER